MRRRRFLSTLAATLSAKAAAPVQCRFRLDARREGPAIPPDFIGFGYEVSAAAVKDFFSASNRVYIQFIRTAAPQGVLRIGGNTADFAVWSPDGQAVSAPVATVLNRAAIEDLGGFLRAAGWKLIWTLNTGRGSPEAAGAEAAAVAAAAGRQLIAFELGNEPDMFAFNHHRPADYGYPRFRAEFDRFAQAVRGRVPGANFAGPAVLAATDWTASFASDERPNIALLTQHYYINDQSTPFATLDNLLRPDARLISIVRKLREISSSAGLAWRLAEANSFSGGGKPGVSDTFAAGLWALDLMFRLAGAGAAGINWETGVNHLGFVSSYSPIFQDENGYSARPVYYALLAFRNALGGQMLDFAPGTTPGASLPAGFRSHAFRDRTGRVWTALINMNASERVSATIEAPEATAAESLFFTAPSLESKTGVLLGGAEVRDSGLWEPAKTPVIRAPNHVVSVDVPPAAAVLVHFRR